MQFLFLLTLLCGLPTLLNAALFNTSLSEGIVPNTYIVTVHEGFALQRVLQRVRDRVQDLQISHTYDSDAFTGFAFSGPLHLTDLLLDLAGIRSIEQDRVVKLDYVLESKRDAESSQANATWGLARISHRQPQATDYVYDTAAQGSDVVAYVIDTGINIEHDDFEGGRAVHGHNIFDNSTNANDDNGHGTHVAGTIGGTTYGVAKDVHLVAVKVVNAEGAGTISGIIAGIQWAVQDMQTRGKERKAVANLSLGGPYVGALNDAVSGAIGAGLFVGVAAGNEGLPAYFFSPASTKEACTVGATDSEDRLATFSNWGSYVDISAPGVNITSAWIDNETDVRTISGTSMATPHLVGVAASFLSGGVPFEGLCAYVQANATQAVKSLFVNGKLLYNNSGK